VTDNGVHAVELTVPPLVPYDADIWA